MVRSLYSGVSGLTTHQTRMDVIGNNIANVNTYGFKASRVTFRDIFYQTAIGASGGRQTFTGNNASQVGYGVQLGSIDKDMSMSSLQGTNRVFDLAIAGDGFFATATFDNQNVNSNKTAANFMYTRMGNFGVDSFGNLCTSNNVFVMGSRNTLDGLLLNSDDSLKCMNDVDFIDRNDDGVIDSTDMTFRDTLNLNELVATAYNIYTDEFGYLYGYNWDDILGSPAAGDDAATPDDGAVEPFAGVIYDEKKLEADGWLVTKDATTGAITSIARPAAGGTTGGGTTATGNALTLEERKKYVDIQETLKALNYPTSDTDSKAAGAKYRYLVDKTGSRIKKDDGTYPAYSGTDGTGGVYDNFFNAGAIVTGDAYKTAAATAGSEGAIEGTFTFGDCESVAVGRDGIITVSYNSTIKSIGRVNIVVFDNPDGLVEDGQTTFVESVASGRPKYKRTMIDPGVTKTTIESAKLEMSNVNLAQEFSDMIVTQRGFQANARIITTSDSMLEELVNLKR